MNLKLIYSSLAAFCLTFAIYSAAAQATASQYFLPEIAPRSPSATAIEKFGTYQVNEFTGVPDISIPLYTVEAGGLQVPITLSYHPSGIKITDVASFVGLGWSLSSSGQISRRCFGTQDDGTFGYLNGRMRQPGTYPTNTLAGVSYLDSAASGFLDSRPDLFSYDFPGHSGKFFFYDSLGVAYLTKTIPYAPLTITHTLVPFTSGTNQTGTEGLTNFDISDEHGNIYRFGGTNAVETTISGSGGVSNETWYGSAWKLQNMISQNRRDTVSFTYQADLVYYPSDDTEIYTVTDDIQTIQSSNYYTASYSEAPTDLGNFNATNELLPQQINFKNGKVVFDLDASARTDLNGTGSNAYGLADIKVYRYNYGTKVMELQKTIVFFKSNFTNGGYRLRLDSIQVQDKAGAVMQHYVFSYNTSITMPDYHSFNQDYWGYYNGPTGASNTMLTPTQTISYQPVNPGSSENVSIGGANRNSDSTDMQVDVLTGIYYPTGGYSTFTYQPNRWDSVGTVTLAGGLRIHTISSYDGINPTPIVKTYVYNSSRHNFILDYTYFPSNQTHRYYSIFRGDVQLFQTAQVRSYSSNPHCDLEGWDAATVVYPSVTEYIGTPGSNVGRTDYTFTDEADALLEASAAGNLVYLSSFYVRGHLLTKKQFINTGSGYQPVELTTNSYTAFPATQYGNAGLAVSKQYFNEGSETNPIPPGATTPDDTNSYLAIYYGIISDDNYLTGTTTNVYDTKDTTKYTTATTTYDYDNQVHQQVTRSYHTDSRGNTEVVRTKYPADYAPGNAIIDSMVNRNMQAEAIEKYDTLKNAATGVNAVTQAQLNQYKSYTNYAIVPAKISTLSVVQPLTNFVPSTVTSGTLTSDSRYVQMISFDSYDSNNNLTQYTARNATPVSIAWNYLGELPVAMLKNSSLLAPDGYSNLYYTSFEADNTGNWAYSGTPVYDPTAPTGNLVYPLSAGNVTATNVPPSQAYVLSLWSNSGAPSVYATSYLTATTYQSYNGWTYYEYQVPSNASAFTVTISGSTSIDELRMYPVNAQMRSYAYDPSGVRSLSDTKGSNAYFDYDYLQRLKDVKDWTGNILKNYTYHLNTQIVPNQAQSLSFTRNNCPPNTTPGSLTFTVPANKYYGPTQASANADAIYDMDTNGQIKANANCGCPVTMISVQVNNTSGVGSFPITFTGVPTYYVNTGTTYISVPANSDYSSCQVGPLGSGTYNFTMGTRPAQNGVHYATFTSVNITTGSSDLTISIAP
jgi:hypothetical protein